MMRKIVKAIILFTSLTGLGAWGGAAMAAVTYQAAGTAVTGTGSVSPAWPAHLINDVALLFIESNGEQAATLSTPAGFVAVANSPQATGAGKEGTRITVFWARATSAAMASPTVADPGDHVYAQIITYRGAVITGNPWDVTGGEVKATASNTVTVTGVTTTVPDTLIVQVVSRHNDRTGAAFSEQINASLTGIAERADGGTTSGNGGGFAVWDGVKATAGATGNTTAKISRSAINAFLTIALMPDITPPTVSSITLANASPTGAASVAWTVVFSESVTGVDSADFSLVQAGGVSGASITSVTGSGTTWTVTANTGSNSGTLGLNLVDNDTILDMAGNRLGGTGLGNGNFTGAVYTIDKLNPLVNTINRAASDPTTAASVSWTVVFSESVTGVNTTDFSLVLAGGVSGASITSVTGSGTTWTVTANTGTGTGTLGLNLVDDDTIKDALSLPLGGAGAGNGNFTGQVYTLDRTAPSVSSINTANANPSTADTVSWTVVFSESVTGVNNGDFTLVASNLTGAFIASVTGSGATWTVVANTGICTGVCTLGLNLVDDDTIIDVVSNKLGGTGAGNGNFTGQVYNISSTLPIAGYSMDEASWNGTAGEVVDSYGVNNGTAGPVAPNNANTIIGDTGICRYGVFDNGGTITQGYISLPDLDIDVLGDFTITAWIRTTNNTIANQRIFTDDDGTTNSYGLSLGDGGAGKLRFYVLGASVVNLDTANVIANNTWYYVAGVADIANGQRSIYVFNAAGALVTSATTPVTGAVGPVVPPGPPGTPTISAPTTKHFKGNLDEVRVYDKVLNQAALTTLATPRTCASAGPDHYELSLPTSSIACLASTATVTVCADAGSPCTNKYTAASGTTATLSTSGGTLASTTVTFDATGVARTTLSFPTVANGTSVSVTLSGEQIVATNLRKCCPDGINCVVGNSCSTTFNTAGFIISSTTGGTVATIPTQVAGTSSSTYYLRAVKTSTTTQACESALSGANSVNFAYECNNPTTCFGANLMSVNGGTATTITRNNNGSVSSYASVDMTFDANGNAPFTFNYSDVGQVKLYASKAPTGSLLSTLMGSSNAFVVKPFGFVLSNIKQTAVPNLGNPAAANASGAKFVKAGEAFSATVTAVTATSTVAPNYGKETAPEGVTLARALVAPATGANPTLGNPAAFGTFSAGVATGTTFNWGEVGIITLTPSVADGDYLGAGDVTGTTSGNVGRFYPNHFDTAVVATASAPLPCPTGLTCPTLYNGFVYSGQAFSTRMTARNLAGAATTNYDGTLGYAKPVTLTAWDALGSTTTQNPSGSLTNSAITAATFSAAVATTTTPVYALATALTMPTDIYMRAIDTDTVSSLRNIASTSVEGGVKVVSGRIKVSNAYGSELLPLTLTATAQLYTASGWVTSSTDTVTSLTLAAAYDLLKNSIITGTTAASKSPVSGLSAGKLTINLAKPSSGATGEATIAPNAPGYLPVTSGRATFGVYKGNNNFIYQRENY